MSGITGPGPGGELRACSACPAQGTRAQAGVLPRATRRRELSSRSIVSFEGMEGDAQLGPSYRAEGRRRGPGWAPFPQRVAVHRVPQGPRPLLLPLQMEVEQPIEGPGDCTGGTK